MEKNIDLIALRYRWPPGSWDDLTIERATRLLQAVSEMIELEKVPEPPDG